MDRVGPGSSFGPAASGGPATQAGLHFARAIAVDSSDVLYIAEPQRRPLQESRAQIRLVFPLTHWNLGAGGSVRLTSGKFARKNSLDLGNFAPCLRRGSAQNFIRFLIKSMEVSSPLRYSRYWRVTSQANGQPDKPLHACLSLDNPVFTTSSRRANCSARYFRPAPVMQ